MVINNTNEFNELYENSVGNQLEEDCKHAYLVQINSIHELSDDVDYCEALVEETLDAHFHWNEDYGFLRVRCRFTKRRCVAAANNSIRQDLSNLEDCTIDPLDQNILKSCPRRNMNCKKYGKF